jgi:actin-related protein
LPIDGWRIKKGRICWRGRMCERKSLNVKYGSENGIVNKWDDMEKNWNPTL